MGARILSGTDHFVLRWRSLQKPTFFGKISRYSSEYRSKYRKNIAVTLQNIAQNIAKISQFLFKISLKISQKYRSYSSKYRSKYRKNIDKISFKISLKYRQNIAKISTATLTGSVHQQLFFLRVWTKYCLQIELCQLFIKSFSFNYVFLTNDSFTSRWTI